MSMEKNTTKLHNKRRHRNDQDAQFERTIQYDEVGFPSEKRSCHSQSPSTSTFAKHPDSSYDDFQQDRQQRFPIKHPAMEYYQPYFEGAVRYAAPYGFRLQHPAAAMAGYGVPGSAPPLTGFQPPGSSMVFTPPPPPASAPPPAPFSRPNPPPPPPPTTSYAPAATERKKPAVPPPPPRPPEPQPSTSSAFVIPTILNQSRVNEDADWGSGCIDSYQILKQIGEGTYGQVYKASRRKSPGKGYGEIVPVTHTGRVFTMLYALAGIPLVLYTISELGRITSLLIGKAYVQLNTRLFTRCCDKTVDDASGFPMVIAFMIAFGWMLLCAGIFCFWEDWDYFTALYFFFQSMTTIGLGDVTPRHPAYMVYALFLVIIGLVLASMVWNLIQMKLDHIVRTTVDRIRQTVLELATEEEEEYGNIRNSIYSVQGLEQAVDQQIPDWFPLLLGEKRRQTLCAEYEQRLRCINRRVQTTPIAEESEGTQTDGPDRLDAHTQTDCENRPVLQLPYMEVMRVGGGGASDEFHTLVQQINYLLSDCRSIVTSDHNT